MTRPFVACALAFVFGLVGCSRGDIERAGQAVASAAPALASDGLIVAQIETKLVAIDGDSALHVAVASHDGNVKLSGRTLSAAIAKRYVAAARGVEGVKNVNASLTADASMKRAATDVSDFALAATVRANLIGQAGVNGIDLDVRAASGAVTLRGKVRTEALRATLLDVAKHTRGVRSVVDALAVDSAS